ncbi:MAG: peptidase M50 [Methanosarcinales archaeon]|nr:MAG: peptidase M50 [Methanosarcinales archaeon]
MARIRTSKMEIRHLTIAWLGISYAFALVLLWNKLGRRPDTIEILGWDILGFLILSLLTVGVAFLLHETGHKVVAQRYECWAEFRMSLPMLMFAILCAYVAGIVFAAPGAVMIFGPHITREQNGKIAVAGPTMNLLLVFLFLPLIGHGGFITMIGAYGVIINIFIAAFNMLPISVLDGRKILYWSKTVYLLVLLASFGMLAWAFVKVVPYLSF